MRQSHVRELNSCQQLQQHLAADAFPAVKIFCHSWAHASLRSPLPSAGTAVTRACRLYGSVTHWGASHLLIAIFQNLGFFATVRCTEKSGKTANDTNVIGAGFSAGKNIFN